MSKIVQPSVSETAFNCPYCDAFTTQHWYSLHARYMGGNKVPIVGGKDLDEQIANIQQGQAEPKGLKLLREISTGCIFYAEEADHDQRHRVFNLNFTECFNCKQIAVWVGDRLAFPKSKTGALPNPDLPVEIVRDFEEAREIVDSSPRGAAALLRLCIQKLCGNLGETGKDINNDIANLVQKGLNPLVQQSLDIVRVIGNESVHPGVMDMKDDRETAFRLFEVVNAIAEQMISHPKSIKEMYAKLPEDKRKAIAKRDKK